MDKAQNVLFSLFLCFPLVVNLLSISILYLRPGRQGLRWTEKAAAETEAVASIWCSGHGQAFLDGFSVDGKAICECNACYGGHDCSELLPGCVVDADSGDPLFLEPLWVQHAAKSTIVVPRWHHMSYHFNDGSLISKELEARIHKLHEVTGNAVTKGRFIIFGTGATQLLNAAVHALSSYDPSSLVRSFHPILSAFAWLKCEREEDEDCTSMLKTVNVTGRNGSLFGAECQYVPLSLVKGQDDFDLLLERMEMLVSAEDESSKTMEQSESITNVLAWNASYQLEGFASEFVERSEGLFSANSN